MKIIDGKNIILEIKYSLEELLGITAVPTQQIHELVKKNNPRENLPKGTKNKQD